MSGLVLSGLMGCGLAKSPQPRAAATQGQGEQSPASFAERLESVPAKAQGSWVIRQLARNRFTPGSPDPAWPHFESRCTLRLNFDPPAKHGFPKHKERRPGRDYIPAIHQVSHSALDWSSADLSAPTFFLQRRIEGGAQEQFFRRDKTLWTQKDQEAWSERPVDDDFHLRWVWEQRQCVAEILELAGPALLLTPIPSSDPAQLTFAVGLHEDSAPVVARDSSLERRGWRAFARVNSMAGELTVDAQQGDWLAANLKVELQVSPPKSAAFRGTVELEAQTKRLEPTQFQWPNPKDASPLPTPFRQQHEQARMLKGLAPGVYGGLGSLR